MSPSEVLWRGSQVVEERIPFPTVADRSVSRLLLRGADWGDTAARFRAAVDRPVLLDRDRARQIAADHPEQVSALVEAAERVRAGRVTYFGYPEAQLGVPIDWNQDPLRYFQWPSRPANQIDHRTASADPKWIWELNRLQHLPWLAQAWLFTGDDSFADVALDHLDSWMEQNPLGRGIAWRGAFEAGTRAISVAVALQGLRDHAALTPQRLARSVRMLAASAELCWRRRSRFSSANNHLVGELSGLATVAVMFPELAAAARWEQHAHRALELEASRQILPDGAGAEQAVGYQLFTAELMLVVAVLFISRGDVPPPGLTDALDRSADYLAAVVGISDPDPRYGDEDEGFALRLGPEPRRTVREHLGIVAALTHNPRARAVGTPTLFASWVEGIVPPCKDPHGNEGVGIPANLYARDGGLVVLRAGTRRLTVDVGPLGYLSIAAHGHADALAVTLSLGGHEVIGDPGAASYYGRPHWREVHRGTLAHPTVSVDQEDQSVSGGPFLWTEHAEVRVGCVDLERGVVDAEHSGYRRLPRPVTHRRWVYAPPQVDAAVLVVDEVSGVGEHQMQVTWPLHHEIDISHRPDSYALSRDGVSVAQVAIVSCEDLVLDEVRADHDTQLGWWSDRLEARTPSWSVSGVVRGRVPLVVATIMQPFGRATGDIVDPTVTSTGDVITVSWHCGGNYHDVVIDRVGTGFMDAAGRGRGSSQDMRFT